MPWHHEHTTIDIVLEIAAVRNLHFSNLHINLTETEEDHSLLIASIARPVINDLLLEIPSLNRMFVDQTLVLFVLSRSSSSPSSSLRLRITHFKPTTTSDATLVPGLEKTALVQDWPQTTSSDPVKKFDLEFEVRFNSAAVVGIRFNRIGRARKGAKVEASFFRSLSSAFPKLESLMFLPMDYLSIFEDWVSPLGLSLSQIRSLTSSRRFPFPPLSFLHPGGLP